VSEKRIDDFVRANAETVFRAIEKYKEIAENSRPGLEYINGENVSVLGEKMPLRIMTDKKSRAELTHEGITILVPDISDKDMKAKALETLMRDVCKKATFEAIEHIYPRVEGLNVPRPTVKFRKMTRKWGVCRPERKEITFSYMLASVPSECIEYVVMHELVHFLHPDHSSRFYERLAELMPDWRERKRHLDKNETE
jgi:predicted metal-dependent hydrolase